MFSGQQFNGGRTEHTWAAHGQMYQRGASQTLEKEKTCKENEAENEKSVNSQAEIN